MKTKFRICVIAFSAMTAFLMAGCSNGTTDSGMPSPGTPVAEDFNVSNLTQYANNVTAVTVTPKAGKSSGAITVYYDGAISLPNGVGTYIVTFNVAAVSGWNAAAGLHGGTLTIIPPGQTLVDPVVGDFDIGNLTQTAGSVTAVTITPKSGKSEGAVTVYYDGSETLPTAVGEYTVTFNVAAATGYNAASGLAGGTLTIIPPEQTLVDPAAGDFNIGNLTQTAGSVTAVTITPKSGKSEGAVTVYYDGSETLPTAIGEYTVTFNVAAATGYNAASGLAGGTLTIIPAGQPLLDPVAGDFDIGSLNQTADNITAVTIMPKTGKSSGSITIYYNGSTTLPTTAGTYTVTFDIAMSAGFNAATGLAGGALTITLVDPIADDFDIGNLNQTADGITAVTITPKTGKSSGSIIIYYNGSTTLPTTAGTYTVTFDVAAAAWWSEAEGLDGGNLVISKIAVSNSSGSATVAYASAGFDLSDIGGLFAVDANAGARTYTIESGGTGTGTIGADNKTLTVTKSGTFTIALVTAGTDNSTAGAKVTSTLTVNKAAGATVDEPEMASRTASSITITAVTAPVNGQTVEYAIAAADTAPSSGWQTGLAFNDLNPGTAYYIFAQSMSNDNYNAGDAVSAAITTLQTLSQGKFVYYWADEHDVLTTNDYDGSGTIKLCRSSGDEVTITLSGENYTDQRWFIDGVEDTSESGSASYTFSSTGKNIKQYMVTLLVKNTDNGKFYNTNVSIAVEE